jgi:hypothetical protein
MRSSHACCTSENFCPTVNRLKAASTRSAAVSSGAAALTGRLGRLAFLYVRGVRVCFGLEGVGPRARPFGIRTVTSRRVADHMDDENAAASVLDQFRRTVNRELALLEIRCVDAVQSGSRERYFDDGPPPSDRIAETLFGRLVEFG